MEGLEPRTGEGFACDHTADRKHDREIPDLGSQAPPRHLQPQTQTKAGGALEMTELTPPSNSRDSHRPASLPDNPAASTYITLVTGCSLPKGSVFYFFPAVLPRKCFLLWTEQKSVPSLVPARRKVSLRRVPQNELLCPPLEAPGTASPPLLEPRHSAPAAPSGHGCLPGPQGPPELLGAGRTSILPETPTAWRGGGGRVVGALCTPQPEGPGEEGLRKGQGPQHTEGAQYVWVGLGRPRAEGVTAQSHFPTLEMCFVSFFFLRLTDPAGDPGVRPPNRQAVTTSPGSGA